MTSSALIERLRAENVRLQLKGDRLLIDAPAGTMTPELRRALQEVRDDLIRHLRLEAAGREILAALAARGITVALGGDGVPRARPGRLVDEVDRVILAAHRDAVIAALTAPEPEPDADPEPAGWHDPCPTCGSRGPCRRREPLPAGGWGCADAAPLLGAGEGSAPRPALDPTKLVCWDLTAGLPPRRASGEIPESLTRHVRPRGRVLTELWAELDSAGTALSVGPDGRLLVWGPRSAAELAQRVAAVRPAIRALLAGEPLHACPRHLLQPLDAEGRCAACGDRSAEPCPW